MYDGGYFSLSFGLALCREVSYVSQCHNRDYCGLHAGAATGMRPTTKWPHVLFATGLYFRSCTRQDEGMSTGISNEFDSSPSTDEDGEYRQYLPLPSPEVDNLGTPHLRPFTTERQLLAPHSPVALSPHTDTSLCSRTNTPIRLYP